MIARYEHRTGTEETTMPDAYLLKTEPSEYSFADLLRDKETVWDGVANPTAVMHMREMKAGDRLIIYETGNVKSAVGTGAVVSATATDPKNPVVKLKVGKALTKPMSLEQIKKHKLFSNSPLVKIGRLSVVPLTAEQYRVLVSD
jgi:predicted RNA-binding protein with PUA-like domain